MCIRDSCGGESGELGVGGMSEIGNILHVIAEQGWHVPMGIPRGGRRYKKGFPKAFTKFSENC